MEGENNPKKEISLDELAQMMNEGFKESGKQTDKKIEELALMVAKGFEEVNEKMDNGFEEVNEKMDNGFKEIQEDTENIKANLNKKVDTFTHKDLEHRVEKLEEKFA